MKMNVAVVLVVVVVVMGVTAQGELQGTTDFVAPWAAKRADLKNMNLGGGAAQLTSYNAGALDRGYDNYMAPPPEFSIFKRMPVPDNLRYGPPGVAPPPLPPLPPLQPYNTPMSRYLWFKQHRLNDMERPRRDQRPPNVVSLF